MEIKELSANGHERLVSCTDGDYHGLIAIHNTHLGPAIGGSRFWQYQNEQEAIVDVLRLARGMTGNAGGCAVWRRQVDHSEERWANRSGKDLSHARSVR